MDETKMYIIVALTFLATFNTYQCQDIKNIFEKINKKVEYFNAVAAEITWEASLNPDNRDLVYKSAVYQKANILWEQRTCRELERLQRHHQFNDTQVRQKYLLCRGPKYTYDEARLTSSIYEELQSIYNEAKLCISTDKNISSKNLTEVEFEILKYINSPRYFSKIIFNRKDNTKYAIKNTKTDVKNEELCLEGDDDFQKLMTFSRNEEVLKHLWLVWRDKVGPPMKEPYRELVMVENVAARRNGYSDIGASWREELEISNLRETCRHLYNEIKPLYTLLHGVARFYLRRQYGDVVPKTGPIPSHLLGDLWSQNWESIADLIIPNDINLDESITRLNWTVHHMVKRAEDFYQSLGFPPMTDTFWKKSLFTKNNNKTRCHGAAANMFKDGDFRLIYCSETTKNDFYVLHHELGHIQYYMAYEHQPALFRQANTALHETIGDTIMYGVLTPQHLHRLGLINDTLLYNINIITIGNKEKYNPEQQYLKNSNENLREKVSRYEYSANKDFNITSDDLLLLKQALSKIPQIPFSLVIDEYRWKYFEGDMSDLELNKEFWQIAYELQGIAPPVKRGIHDFDIGAKFHIPDNTPFIRYFLSSFLQHQLFESLCKAAVFGRRGGADPLPNTITMNRCDIYGSKTAGKLLRDIMSRGHSQHWRQILQETTGQDNISASALKRYYRPLYKVLEKLVQLQQIPIGW